MPNLFNNVQFNVEPFNEGDVVEVQAGLVVNFSVEERVYSGLIINFSLPLQRELDIDFLVSAGIWEPLIVDFQVNQTLSYTSRKFVTDFSVADILESSLIVDFQVQTQKALDIVFDVDIVKVPLWVRFSVPEFVTETLDIDFEVDDTISFTVPLDIIFSVETPKPIPVTLPIEFPFALESSREPDGYVDLASDWPPTYLDETEPDDFGAVTVSTPVSDQTYTVGAVSFDTQIFVINNECAQVTAKRMLESLPTEIKNLVYDAEKGYQDVTPSTLNLYTRQVIIGDFEHEPKLALTLSRLSADVGRPKDVEVWVSGIAPSGSILPAHQKCLYLRYGAEPNLIVESYVGTVDEIAANILLESSIVDIHSLSLNLTRNITQYDANITLADVTGLPDTGYIVINGMEVIYYAIKTGNILQGCQRGVFGTTASNHEMESDVRSTFTYDRQTPTFAPASLEADSGIYKLANTRKIGLINDSNSKHLALWKTMATEICFLWTNFNDKVNSFFTRFAKLPELKKIANNIGTNQWHYLEWEKLKGHTLSAIEANFTVSISGVIVDNEVGEAPFYVAITDDLYTALNTYNLTGCHKKNPRLFKIDNEYMYIRWIGPKSSAVTGVSTLPCDISEYVPTVIANDTNITYVMYVDERAVEHSADWTVGVAHSAYTSVEYIPIDLRNYSTDGQLLTRARKEPSHLFRERLRLYHGQKANKASFRAIYDVLEDIIPGSEITFWDYHSFVDGKNDDPHGPKVDKEVGWLLGVPGRTEIGFSTYLGLQLYTQGYWEWVWGSEDAQMLQVKGRYPFFVRAKEWWFDPELLYEVTDRFKSAGTTPNYAINTEVVTWPVELDIITTNEMEAFPSQLLQNPQMDAGIVSVLGQPIDVSNSVANEWTISTALIADGTSQHSKILEHVGATTSSQYAVKLVNESITTALDFYQSVSALPAGDYHGQFLIRPDAAITYNAGGNNFTGHLVLYVLDLDTGAPLAGTNIFVEPYDGASGWYLMKFWFTLAAESNLNLGISTIASVGTDRECAITNAWLVQETIVDTTPDARGDNVHPVRINQNLAINFGVYTKRITTPLYVSFSVES